MSEFFSTVPKIIYFHITRMVLCEIEILQLHNSVRKCTSKKRDEKTTDGISMLLASHLILTFSSIFECIQYLQTPYKYIECQVTFTNG